MQLGQFHAPPPAESSFALEVDDEDIECEDPSEHTLADAGIALDESIGSEEASELSGRFTDFAGRSTDSEILTMLLSDRQPNEIGCEGTRCLGRSPSPVHTRFSGQTAALPAAPSLAQCQRWGDVNGTINTAAVSTSLSALRPPAGEPACSCGPGRLKRPAGFSSIRPSSVPAPAELRLPESGSSTASSSGPSPSDPRPPRGAWCTPVLRRARMYSPDEDDGVLAPIPREDERPGAYERRRRPWPVAL